MVLTTIKNTFLQKSFQRILSFNFVLNQFIFIISLKTKIFYDHLNINLQLLL